jgi:non-heme chloroperoxidase
LLFPTPHAFADGGQVFFGEAAMKKRFISAPDGLRLAVYDGGNPQGRETLFIHDFSQSALCFKDLFESPDLARRFRLTAFDIRGHGSSAKPLDPERYRDDRTFAGDIKAAMEALELKRPVVVAWSYAGRLVSDYVSAFGTSRIAGINYVGARTKDDPEFNGAGTSHFEAMGSDDAKVAQRATKAFINDCFAVEQPFAQIATLFIYSMMVPAAVRGYHLRRPPSDGAILPMLDVPVLVTQGTEDRVVLPGLAEWTAKSIPGAHLSLYEDIGHAPFIEDRPRFARELIGFLRRVGAAEGKR